MRRKARLLLLAFPFSLLTSLASCTGDMSEISRFERQTPPDQEVKQAHIRRSEQARLQIEVDAPLIRQYKEPSPRTVYPNGVELRFYDENRNIKSSIRADKAISYDDRNIMKATDSVVVIDYASGDTIYLDDLIWRDAEDVIFSNHPVRAVNGNRVTYGDGFVSDEQMTNLRITRQRGVIEFEE
ncbi:MAG: LPS export ABC transporter periplasmic protein LptC [Bacteroidales bacterium]|nr:LPS export ABC transporter periplasmic protein LptC [Bacteroidales bacterium]